jgi:hypothetical protein
MTKQQRAAKRRAYEKMVRDAQPIFHKPTCPRVVGPQVLHEKVTAPRIRLQITEEVQQVDIRRQIIQIVHKPPHAMKIETKPRKKAK